VTFTLLWCYSAYIGNESPTFRDSHPVGSFKSRANLSILTPKMTELCSSETSVTVYESCDVRPWMITKMSRAVLEFALRTDRRKTNEITSHKTASLPWPIKTLIDPQFEQHDSQRAVPALSLTSPAPKSELQYTQGQSYFFPFKSLHCLRPSTCLRATVELPLEGCMQYNEQRARSPYPLQ
jgi:hypothetical protein